MFETIEILGKQVLVEPIKKVKPEHIEVHAEFSWVDHETLFESIVTYTARIKPELLPKDIDPSAKIRERSGSLVLHSKLKPETRERKIAEYKDKIRNKYSTPSQYTTFRLCDGLTQNVNEILSEAIFNRDRLRERAHTLTEDDELVINKYARMHEDYNQYADLLQQFYQIYKELRLLQPKIFEHGLAGLVGRLKTLAVPDDILDHAINQARQVHRNRTPLPGFRTFRSEK